ncbi:hypothetical protein FE257_007941 [Aspergillus nanangensis]|uniref:Uncharacterized protein n=1 Tax=Aspergillus nanangensis TaxID=2582783 RepID=A0AAD4CZ22_ASPNN|nr:hypothetical protein FE257_007941 [Aspergillus nanangensis]
MFFTKPALDMLVKNAEKSFGAMNSLEIPETALSPAFFPNLSMRSRTGPYACAGEQLALMELRLVVAEVLRRYDPALAPSQTEGEFWAQHKDHYTLAPSPLWLQFTKRSDYF